MTIIDVMTANQTAVDEGLDKIEVATDDMANAATEGDTGAMVRASNLINQGWVQMSVANGVNNKTQQGLTEFGSTVIPR